MGCEFWEAGEVKNFCCLAILMSVLVLVGCDNERARLNVYLEELAASQVRVQGISGEFQEALSRVSKNSSTVQIEVAATIESWDQILARLKAEKTRVQRLSVPAGAEGLNSAVLEQYQVLIETVEVSRPLVDIAEELSQANRRAEEDPGAAKQITQDMASAEVRRKEVADQLEELLTRGRLCEDEVRKQQQKLQKEFGVALQLEEHNRKPP
jgi:hypothetical protein